MRSRLVASINELTPLGEWIAARVPHVEYRRGFWGHPDTRIFRVFGFKPLYRKCLVDFTKAADHRGYSLRFRLFGWVLIDRRVWKEERHAGV